MTLSWNTWKFRVSMRNPSELKIPFNFILSISYGGRGFIFSFYTRERKRKGRGGNLKPQILVRCTPSFLGIVVQSVTALPYGSNWFQTGEQHLEQRSQGYSITWWSCPRSIIHQAQLCPFSIRGPAKDVPCDRKVMLMYIQRNPSSVIHNTRTINRPGRFVRPKPWDRCILSGDYSP